MPPYRRCTSARSLSLLLFFSDFGCISVGGAGERGSHLAQILPSVGFEVIIQEEDEEDDGVDVDGVAEDDGVVAAVVEEELGRVEVEGDKLDELDSRHPRLPPQVRVVSRSQSGDAVVRVHHHVDERVHRREKSTVTTCRSFNIMS